MNDKIQNYINDIFKDVPQKKSIMVIKEELLSNLNEKYQDLINDGKSEDEAFSIVVSGIGDIESLIDDVSEVDRKTFTDTTLKNRQGSLLIPIGVALYFFGIALLILIDEVSGLSGVGVSVMMCVFAVATGIIIYGGSLKKKKYLKEDNSFVEEYKEKISMSDKSSRMASAITSSVWTLIVLLYFILSFSTYRWDITWVIFLVGAVIDQVIKSIINKKINTGGIIWTSAVVIYFLISFTTYQWQFSWMVFLVAAAVQQMVRLYNIWREK